ncbi:hypothetical protein [Streptomyces zaomyceticus]|uniref:hypothetical protein n=1 Tax=Streptomyces zaomyceticus TaxID=68286 RepID=UPI00342BD205
MTTAEERTIPPFADLTWEQHAGRNCVHCDRPLHEGAREVGRVKRDYGVPLREVPVYAGPCCLGLP